MQLPLKIYFNNCELHISDTGEVTLSKDALIQAIESFEKGVITKITFSASDYGAAHHILSEVFTIIEAGGGVVTNPNNEILFIFRRGKWDLPKGKKEANETIENCAVREVEEECGLSDILLENLIHTSWHIYKERNTYILKASYWYKMHISYTQKTIPQLEEEITEVKWVATNTLNSVLENTFPNIRELIKIYLEGY